MTGAVAAAVRRGPSRPTASSTPSTARPTATGASSGCNCRTSDGHVEDQDTTIRGAIHVRRGNEVSGLPAPATAPTLEQTDVLAAEGVTPDIRDGLPQLLGAAGIQDGGFAKILMTCPASASPTRGTERLPAAAAQPRCRLLYLIIAGDLQVGSETLGKGDGFFVPA